MSQRVVPGAPPPTTPSKGQKKKRSKPKAQSADPETPIEGASPLPSDLPEAKEPPVVTPTVESAPPEIGEDGDLKPSPIVELVSKRLKATTKKIVTRSPLRKPTPLTDSACLDSDKNLRRRRS